MSRSTNLARTLRVLKEAGLWIVGTAGDGEQELHEADLTGPPALVLGSEGEGLRRLTREMLRLHAAPADGGAVESLNVSVAAGILLYEALRQRQRQALRQYRASSGIFAAPWPRTSRGIYSLPHRKRVSGWPQTTRST